MSPAEKHEITTEEKQEAYRIINFGHDVRKKVKIYLTKENRAYNAQEIEVLKEHILMAVACTPMALEKLCEAYVEWPCVTTIQKWEREDEDFAKGMTMALKQQARVCEDLALEIACDKSQDVEYWEKGAINMSVRVSRDKLAISQLNRRASYHNREVYGNAPINPLDQQKIETQEEYVGRMNRLKQEILERERLASSHAASTEKQME